ncbi:MAG: GAF domain-containing protein [Cytophagales bacterium]|nr:GAF domain-containing protein [Cytophagales bacterium]
MNFLNPLSSLKKSFQVVVPVLFTLFLLYNLASGYIRYNELQIERAQAYGIYQPAINSLHRYEELILNIQGEISHWLLGVSSKEEKEYFRIVLNRKYPEAKEELLSLSKQLNQPKLTEQLTKAFAKYQKANHLQHTLLSILALPADYSDSIKVKRAMNIYENSLQKNYKSILEDIQQGLATVSALHSQQALQLQENETIRLQSQLIVSFLLFAAGLVFSFYKLRQLKRGLHAINQQVDLIGKEERPDETLPDDKLPAELQSIYGKLEKFGHKVEDIFNFVQEVSKGNYSHRFSNLTQNDRLGNSLLSMRDNLQKAYEEDLARNWSNEGHSAFAGILRENNDNIKVLSDNILSRLIEYLKANQGNLFILKEEAEESYMQLEACYAWDKKRFHEAKIRIGDGLIGQSWIERDTIFLTDIPEEFITITSGIGNALPTCILIVPLITNEKVYGVIELASFEVFKPHEVEFVEKLSESIASTISNARGYERTQKLLEESKELTEQMRAQEEEMRQNMEELQATQEEMFRKEQNTQNKQHIFEQAQWTIELDENFFVRNTNRLAATDLGYPKEDLVRVPFGKILSDDSPLSLLKDITGHEVLNQVWTFTTRGGRALLVKVTAGVHTDPMSDERIYSVYGTNITNVAVTEV